MFAWIVRASALALIAAGVWRLAVPAAAKSSVFIRGLSAWQAVGMILGGATRFMPEIGGVRDLAFLLGMGLFAYPLVVSRRPNPGSPPPG